MMTRHETKGGYDSPNLFKCDECACGGPGPCVGFTADDPYCGAQVCESCLRDGLILLAGPRGPRAPLEQTWKCDDCGEIFSARRPQSTDTNQDVMCPRCKRIDTREVS